MDLGVVLFLGVVDVHEQPIFRESVPLSPLRRPRLLPSANLHDPEAGHTKDDLERSQQAADAREPRVGRAAAHVSLGGRQHEDVADGADAREGAEEDVKRRQPFGGFSRYDAGPLRDVGYQEPSHQETGVDKLAGVSDWLTTSRDRTYHDTTN